MKETKNYFGGFELKASANDKGERLFSGYLAVFGNKDSYDDIIEKGAFAVDLAVWRGKGYYPPVLEQHGGWGMSATDNTPIGYFSNMEEDDYGLKVEGYLFSTNRGEDMYTILKEAPKGSIGMSIGYKTVRKEIVENPDGSRYRILKELKLLEGSIVTFPANEEARVEDVKSEKTFTVREVENMLKNECELSKKQSETVISKLKDLGWPIKEELKSEENVEEIKTEDKTLGIDDDKKSDALQSGLESWAKQEKEKLEEEQKQKKLQELFKDIENLVKS